MGRIDRFIQLGCGRRRRCRHKLIGIIVIDRTKHNSPLTVGLLDPGLEDIGHTGLVSDLTSETIRPVYDLARRCNSHSCIARFVGIDPHVCSIRVRTGRYHVRNTLFGAVPFPDKLLGDVVAGAELKIRNFVFGFVGCRIIGVFGCFVPIRAFEIARCTGFDTAHDVATFALRPDVTHIVGCSRCYDEYTTFGIGRVLRPRRLLQGLYRIAVGDRRPFIGSVLFFYPPPRFARIGVRRLVARYGEVNLRVFRRSDFGIIGFADDKSYVGIVASDGIALAPYVTCYNRSG